MIGDIVHFVDTIGSNIDDSPFVPDHWHPVVKENGKIRVDMTPGCGEKKGVIYVFRDKTNGELLIGMTGQKAQKRVYQYNHVFNSEKEASSKRFPTEVKKRPDDFEWAILYVGKKGERLGWVETAFIIAFNSIVKGFNRTQGGNGGSVGEPPIAPIVDSPMKTAEELLKNVRFYEIEKDEDGFFKASNLTPNAKTRGDKVYVVFVDNECYVGMTGQSLSKRLASHIHAMNHPEKEVGQRSLAKRARTGTKLKVGVVRKDVFAPHHEVKTMTILGKVYKLINIKAGGGGSRPQNDPAPAVSGVKRKLDY